MRKITIGLIMIFLMILSLLGCNHQHDSSSPRKEMRETSEGRVKITGTKNQKGRLTPYPTSVAAVVNKNYYLQKNYVPKDLVYPNVSFIFKEKVEKRKMRKEAAEALERMFAAAKREGIYLSGVSAYRSYATQKKLFEYYVKRDGLQKAQRFSAAPGTSEHQTGLAVDVSGSTGKCAASACFAQTKESAWLNKNSANYGYIVRYPKGKEKITGYGYEPWHLRYVGHISKRIINKGLTLEEYLKVPAIK